MAKNENDGDTYELTLDKAREKHIERAETVIVESRRMYDSELRELTTGISGYKSGDRKEYLEYAQVVVDTMAKLHALGDAEVREAQREIFYSALSDFQYLCPPIYKEAEAHNYKYANLAKMAEIIHPALNACGLCYTFSIQTVMHDGVDMPFVSATCHLSHVCGFTQSNVMEVPVEYTGRINRAQSHGSAQTYAQRYALMSALGLTPHDMKDDDGASSSRPQASRQSKPSRSKPPQQKTKLEDELCDANRVQVLLGQVATVMQVTKDDLVTAIKQKIADHKKIPLEEVNLDDVFVGKKQSKVHKKMVDVARDVIDTRKFIDEMNKDDEAADAPGEKENE